MPPMQLGAIPSSSVAKEATLVISRLPEGYEDQIRPVAVSIHLENNFLCKKRERLQRKMWRDVTGYVHISVQQLVWGKLRTKWEPSLGINVGKPLSYSTEKSSSPFLLQALLEMSFPVLSMGLMGCAAPSCSISTQSSKRMFRKAAWRQH